MLKEEANRKFYGSNCKARNILAGQVDIPPACEALMRVLIQEFSVTNFLMMKMIFIMMIIMMIFQMIFQTPHQIVIHHLQEIAEAL